MADKTISQLVSATKVTAEDLLVLEQNGQAKKLAGKVLEEWVDSKVAEYIGEYPNSGGSSGGNADIDAAVAKYLTENPVTGGMTQTEKNLILTLFRNAAYVSGNMNATLTQLESIWSGSGDVPVNPEKTLTSISAVYSGGSVTAGTAVSALTGIVVTAHYSDGTNAIVTGYALSGTIADGSNTITVSYGGKTATFAVTGVANFDWESGTPYVIDEFTENAYLKSDGTEEAYNGWKISEYLPCKGVDMLTGLSNTMMAAYCRAYNSNKEDIWGLIEHNANTDKFGTTIYTVCNSAEFVRFSMSNSDWSKTEITPFAVKRVTPTTVMETGEIYAIKDWEAGALKESDGNITVYGNWYASGFIPCSGLSKVYLSMAARKNVCFYDISKNHLSTIAAGGNASFDVPDNASFMRISATFNAGIANPMLITAE